MDEEEFARSDDWCGEQDMGWGRRGDKLSLNGTRERVKSYTRRDARPRAHVRTSNTGINTHVGITRTRTDNSISIFHGPRRPNTYTHSGAQMVKATKSTQSQTERWCWHACHLLKGWF